MHLYIKEACVETLEEAILAERQGANQLELCSLLEHDGLTPYSEVVQAVAKAVSIPFKVMIRPRVGDFFYTSEEIRLMETTIHELKHLQPAGFVLGALEQTSEGQIQLDMDAIQQLCLAALPYEVTIHKAIDNCTDIIGEAVRLKTISNIKYILTSGGANKAENGIYVLQQLQLSVHPVIQVIAAGKITSENINDLHKILKLGYYHGRKITS